MINEYVEQRPRVDIKVNFFFGHLPFCVLVYEFLKNNLRTVITFHRDNEISNYNLRIRRQAREGFLQEFSNKQYEKEK